MKKTISIVIIGWCFLTSLIAEKPGQKSGITPCPGAPTVTDIDGNVYTTVLIGDQCWIRENLRTTNYRDGSPIEYPGTDNEAWENNTTGAYTWYNNDIGWKDIYGALYNWYAVNNVKGLCPTGWKEPTNTELTQLVNYVISQGFPNVFDNQNGAGSALKSCRQEDSHLGSECNTIEHPRWDPDNTHYGFDEFGFSALPGGYRFSSSGYSNVGDIGYWWSATENTSTNAWCRGIRSVSGDIGNWYYGKNYGFSVRCFREFDPSTSHNLDLQVNPLGAGTVTGAGEHGAGIQVSISATANPGYEFVNWTGDTEHVDDATSANAIVMMPAFDITLTANFKVKEPTWQTCPGIPTVTDIDGNVYTTVLIGDQCWIRENLRVKKYNNEVAIHTGLSDTEWSITTQGAYAIYPHNDINGLHSDAEVVSAYGKLYNWHAVNDSRGLCPAGWSEPCQDDWTQLLGYVVEQGYSDGPGNALKSCRQVGSPLGGDCATSVHPRWNSHGTHYGFDEFVFSALPGGFRRATDGSFDHLGSSGGWWFSTESLSTSAWQMTLTSDSWFALNYTYYKGMGLSVRCFREFDPLTSHNLDLQVNPLGAGTVTGAGEHGAGIQVSISATANPGYEFVNWIGDTEHVDNANSAHTTVTMPASDISLTASFVEADIPGNLLLFNETISDGDTECFAALQTITVSDFTVESGGNATFIAGQSIHLLPGTIVIKGGYLLARIAANENDFCATPKAVEIAEEPFNLNEDVVSVDPPNRLRGNDFFRVYPNPTTGRFTLELTHVSDSNRMTLVEVYGMRGEQVLRQELPADMHQHTLNLTQNPPGIYIIRVLSGNAFGTERIIRR